MCQRTLCRCLLRGKATDKLQAHRSRAKQDGRTNASKTAQKIHGQRVTRLERSSWAKAAQTATQVSENRKPRPRSDPAYDRSARSTESPRLETPLRRQPAPQDAADRATLRPPRTRRRRASAANSGSQQPQVPVTCLHQKLLGADTHCAADSDPGTRRRPTIPAAQTPPHRAKGQRQPAMTATGPNAFASRRFTY